MVLMIVYFTLYILNFKAGSFYVFYEFSVPQKIYWEGIFEPLSMGQIAGIVSA
tara:strand:+ start:295 stop:453 length:159 start_codon:yes stop_codon:yes gene_type:complete